MKAKTKVKNKIKRKKGWKFIKSPWPRRYLKSLAPTAVSVLVAGIFLVAMYFAAGALLQLPQSKPATDSRDGTENNENAPLAEQGLLVYSEQIIDVASPVFTELIKQYRDELGITAKELAERKEKLRLYLAGKNSPFAQDDGAITAFANAKNMKLMVAISFVESTFGKNCYFYNCSGIGGAPPNLRKYESYAEWIRDFDDLLERRYKDIPIEGFIGLYVQPGSPNWLYGVKQVLAELDALEF